LEENAINSIAIEQFLIIATECRGLLKRFGKIGCRFSQGEINEVLDGFGINVEEE